jgi:hypothetical protein
LSKKKANEALPDEEKTLPMDALGVVMIVHGEEFPKESEFGELSVASSWCLICFSGDV